jgi:hypothetical protein
MIVWNGSMGGRYCACGGGAVSTWYPDADGDGYGVDSTGVPFCSQPPGYVAYGGDCNDSVPGIHPGADEINDGIDNQCPGDTGFGVVDEVSGIAEFADPEDRNAFSWNPQAGATSYEVIRSTSRTFDSGCISFMTTTAGYSDAEVPVAGTSFFYLVRSAAPFVGSWGQDSSGTERVIACP